MDVDDELEPSRQIFELLGYAAVRERKLVVRATSIEIDKRFVSHAVASEGQWLVIVPLPNDSPTATDSNLAGLLLETHTVNEQASIFVRCLDPDSGIQFSYFVDDLLQHLQEMKKSPLATVLDCVQAWKNIFSRRKLNVLGTSQQIGLLGELLLLEAIAKTKGNESLKSWSGPIPGRHDFVHGKFAVEVKSTLTRDRFPISIHGTYQLESPKNGELWLLGFQFEEHPGGQGIPELVQRIMALGIDAPSFTQLLLQEGFDMKDAQSYEEFKFKVLRTKITHVTDATPRIVRSSVVRPEMLDSLSGLAYSIDLGPLSAAGPDDQALEVAVKKLGL